MGLQSSPIGKVKGHAFTARSSRRVPASLVWGGTSVRLESADGALLHEGAVTLNEQLPGGPQLVHIEDGWLFEVACGQDGGNIPGPRHDRWLSSLETWHPRLAGVLVVCLLAGFTIWRWGLGLLVSLALALTPHHIVKGIDASQMAIVDRSIARQTRLSDETRDRVSRIFNDLIAKADAAPWGGYQLHFRDMPEIGANAFAMPGGTIVITDQLVEQFKQDEDVIAAVLGHEIAHVFEKHGLAQLYRAGSIYLLVTLIVGDAGPILEGLLREGNLLLSLSYSREHEEEADRLGVRTAQEAGYDGTALARFFESLEKEGGVDGPSWMSTHPSNHDRIEKIRSYSRGSD